MNIVISGSSSGIGAGLARYFAQKKHNVCITYNKSKAKADIVAKDLKKSHPTGQFLVEKLDVTQPKSAEALASKIESTFKTIDLLISNAGVDYQAPIEQSNMDDWENIFRTKADGAYIFTRALIPLLKTSGTANIIFISASVAWKPDWSDPAYSSASAAVNNFAQSMSIALAKYGIRSNVVCPGPIKTDMRFWNEIEQENSSIWEQMKQNNPLGRLCTIDDIGSLINYIAIDGTYINGNILYLNGGTHLK